MKKTIYLLDDHNHPTVYNVDEDHTFRTLAVHLFFTPHVVFFSTQGVCFPQDARIFITLPNMTCLKYHIFTRDTKVDDDVKYRATMYNIPFLHATQNHPVLLWLSDTDPTPRTLKVTLSVDCEDRITRFSEHTLCVESGVTGICSHVSVHEWIGTLPSVDVITDVHPTQMTSSFVILTSDDITICLKRVRVDMQDNYSHPISMKPCNTKVIMSPPAKMMNEDTLETVYKYQKKSPENFND